jgi:hypothetical protein
MCWRCRDIKHFRCAHGYDGHYPDATVSSTGDLLFDLIGVVDDPFVGVYRKSQAWFRQAML